MSTLLWFFSAIVTPLNRWLETEPRGVRCEVTAGSPPRAGPHAFLGLCHGCPWNTLTLRTSEGPCGGMDDVWFEVEASSSGGSVGTSWSAEVGVTWHCGGQGVRDGHMGVVASFRATS